MQFSLFLVGAALLVNHVPEAVEIVEDYDGSGDYVYLEESGLKQAQNSTFDGSAEEVTIIQTELPGSGLGEQPIPTTSNDGAALVEFVTGTLEGSTMPPKDPVGMADGLTDEPEAVDMTGPTTPFDISLMETGSPEGSTKEPYMPKPKPKPNKDNNGTLTDSSDSPLVTLDVDVVTDYPENASEMPAVESIAPVHWKTTTTNRIDYTISQKIDENSAGYEKLLHMLEDLNVRRKEDTTGSNQTQFYISRASVAMDTIENTYTNSALANITYAQEYIKGLLKDASDTVRQGYTQIVSLTNTPSFYYIPKKQRYLMVNEIIAGLGASGQEEIMSLNKQAKTYCQNSNVDTPPYSFGNILGNKLANGAILTK
ncbi:unnamed protein product [Caenorhabditis sp. 36 PRJEB53466]|nr:unnamed protein product [Caenorhabditis sp. 36 PRJEB53466]